MAKKYRIQKLMSGKPVKIDPIEFVIAGSLLAIGAIAVADAGRNTGYARAQDQLHGPQPRPQHQPRAGQYGSVAPTMGGRGPHAGAGVSGPMGGRTARESEQYDYDTPSATATQWDYLP